MGLDMYFEARKSAWKSFSRYDKEEKVDETNYPEDLKVMANYIFENNYKAVSKEEYYQIGYFRKFNALHGYIVDHFADGVDACQRIYLNKKDIEQMLEICLAIKADSTQAEKLFPTTSGCFFGGQDYDEYYFEDIERAIKFFKLVLANVDFDIYDVVYQASW